VEIHPSIRPDVTISTHLGTARVKYPCAEASGRLTIDLAGDLL
jgi:hypothetical protein